MNDKIVELVQMFGPRFIKLVETRNIIFYSTPLVNNVAHYKHYWGFK